MKDYNLRHLSVKLPDQRQLRESPMQNPFVQMTDAERAERRARFFAEEDAAGPEATGVLALTAKLYREAKRHERRARLVERQAPAATTPSQPNAVDGDRRRRRNPRGARP